MSYTDSVVETPDDMHCGVCGTDVYSTRMESYTVYEWNVEEQRNVFYAIYCPLHAPERSSS